MDRLVNLCGKAMRLEDIGSFGLNRVNYVYIPCFREINEIVTKKRNILSKGTSEVVTRYEFCQHIPYGMMLGDKDEPIPGDTRAFKITSPKEFIAMDLYRHVKKIAGDAAHLAARKLNIDTSINQKVRILLDGSIVKEYRYDEIPAKLIYSDGRKVDVYKGSDIYNQIGQDLTPVVESVPTLEVLAGKNRKYVFCGNGIDAENVEEVYQTLLAAYNLFHTEAEQEKLEKGKKILPGIGIGSVRIQSPFVLKKSEKEETADKKDADGKG